MSKVVVVGIMFAARVLLALACVVGLESCSGDVTIEGQIEVCPEPAPCMSCEELVLSGGDARDLCDGEGDAFYRVWECVVDAPQCTVCPDWYNTEVFKPTALDESCLQCLVLEGCAAELNTCGVSVSL